MTYSEATLNQILFSSLKRLFLQDAIERIFLAFTYFLSLHKTLQSYSLPLLTAQTGSSIQPATHNVHDTNVWFPRMVTGDRQKNLYSFIRGILRIFNILQCSLILQERELSKIAFSSLIVGKKFSFQRETHRNSDS